jgi:hypothetical protein
MPTSDPNYPGRHGARASGCHGNLRGVRAFRDTLNKKLDLAATVADRLCTMPELELPWRPEPGTVAFRVRIR